MQVSFELGLVWIFSWANLSWAGVRRNEGFANPSWLGTGVSKVLILGKPFVGDAIRNEILWMQV